MLLLFALGLAVAGGLRDERAISRLQSRVIAGWMGESGGCFGREMAADSSTVDELVLADSPLDRELYSKLANLTDYQPCGEDAHGSVDVWDFDLKQFRLDQPSVDCNANVAVAARSEDGALEQFGLVAANAFKLSLFQPRATAGEDALLRQVGVLLFNSLRGVWVGGPHYFLFKLVASPGGKLRGIEFGNGVIPRDLRKAAVELVRSNNNDNDKWRLLYQAPECTLYFPSPRLSTPKAPFLPTATTSNPIKRQETVVVDEWVCKPAQDVVDPSQALFDL